MEQIDNTAVKQKKRASKSFYLDILRLLREGIRPSRLNNQGEEEGSIAAILHTPKQNLNYYIQNLKAAGYIKHIGLAWQVLIPEGTDIKIPSKRKLSIGATIPKVANLHAFNIEFPILEGEVRSADWEIKERLKNWIPKYKKVKSLGGLTFKNNNNKSITIFCHARDLDNEAILNGEVENLGMKIRAFVYDYFLKKEGVTLDIFNCKTKNLNLATQDVKLQGLVKKGEVLSVDLGKEAQKIFPNDSIPATAYVDNTPLPNSVETNDIAYKKAYIMQPLYVESLLNSMPAIQEYNKNILLHMGVMEDMKATLKDIRDAVKELKK